MGTSKFITKILLWESEKQCKELFGCGDCPFRVKVKIRGFINKDVCDLLDALKRTIEEEC